MTRREFIPYEEALALKELGFKDHCICAYNDSKILLAHYPQKCFYGYNTSDCIGLDGLNEYEILAPLYQQAFRWFRGEYDLVAEIQAPDGKNGKWNPTIHKVYGFGNHYDNDGFDTYEEAELACLRKLIEIVKKGGKDE